MNNAAFVRHIFYMEFKLRIKRIYILFFSLVLINCSGGNENNLVEFHGSTMGTSYSIKIVDSKLFADSGKSEELKKSIDEVLANVNKQMSTWQDDSEISQFNKSNSTDWFPVSEDFINVVEHAQKISVLSNGSFDITVGKLVNLWGFGPSSKADYVPLTSELEDALNHCDYNKISINKEMSALRKDYEDIYIDLSSIAKGFGVDTVSNFILESGYSNFLVEIGGEVRTSGKNNLNEFWKIGISTPDGSFEIQKVIKLNNVSVATSGDYRNYFEKNGVRYSHTIDPKTGKPITHNLASVTVISDNCTMADGLATAIDVLGPEKGYELALKEKLPVFLIVKTDKGFIEKMTPEFEKLFKN